ncbi:tetratricopeptide repeat protein [Flexithrix dorotheae]|uniref:tetratricopeptide repeat protein n=1 Tax=Flexithrix dorotheae TaxID=70993 RepID=UPI00035E0E3F|nr:PD40 domain-containing protein [Flexithrix dorotheae]
MSNFLIRYYLICICFFSSFSLSAQDSVSDADLLFENNELGKALNLYTSLLQTNPENSYLSYKVGVCYLFSQNHKTEALPYIYKAAEARDNGDSQIPVDVYYYLGKVLHYNRNFELAFNVGFNKYREEAILNRLDTLSDAKFIEATRMIRVCNNGNDILKNYRLKDVKVETFPFPINTSYNDAYPIIPGNGKTLLLSSNRPIDEFNLIIGEDYVFLPEKLENKTQFAFQSQWNESENEWNFPYVEFSGGKIVKSYSLTNNGNEILLGIGNSEDDIKLYSSVLKKGKWSIPKLLSPVINIPGSTIMGGCFASGGKELFFSSNRPGGYGGFDLYHSVKAENGEWSSPVNLGDVINTPFDEITPFLQPGSRELYFSSDGHYTMGYQDIFVSKQFGNSWEPPRNMGFPINSAYDDICYNRSGDGEQEYFSSNRKGIDGLRTFGGFEILKIERTREKMPLAMVSGKIKILNGDKTMPVNLKVREKDKTGYQYFVFDPRGKEGEYFMILPTNKNYSLDIISPIYESAGLDINIPKDTYQFEFNVEIRIDTINIFDKPIGEELVISDYKHSSININDNASLEERIKEIRYDALVAIMSKMTEYTQKSALEGLAGLEEKVEYVIKEKEKETDDYYNTLVGVFDEAVRKKEKEVYWDLNKIIKNSNQSLVQLFEYENSQPLVEQVITFKKRERDISNRIGTDLMHICKVLNSNPELRLHLRYLGDGTKKIVEERKENIIKFLEENGALKSRIEYFVIHQENDRDEKLEIKLF